jgi:phage baseplate assembly protein W
MDILLKETSNGQYDRVIEKSDFKTIKGDDVLRNRILIYLLTRSGELDFLPNYLGFGCDAGNYLKHNNTSLTRLKIQEAVKKALNNIKDVERVDYVIVEEKTNKSHLLSVSFSIKTLNGDRLDFKL